MSPLLFVTHPRTRDRLKRVNAGDRMVDINHATSPIKNGFIYLVPPLAYLDFLRMMSTCKAVLTDSGGIQEETTFLRIPCLTMRNNTERPSTVKLGTNIIVGPEREKILSGLERVMNGSPQNGSIPPLWDGHAAERVVEVLRTNLN